MAIPDQISEIIDINDLVRRFEEATSLPHRIFRAFRGAGWNVRSLETDDIHHVWHVRLLADRRETVLEHRSCRRDLRRLIGQAGVPDSRSARVVFEGRRIDVVFIWETGQSVLLDAAGRVVPQEPFLQ